MISNIMAKAINTASNASLEAVASRNIQKATSFAQEYGVKKSFDSWNEMLNWKGIDALYIGVPTAAKEEIAIAAAKKGKHILVDKPFSSYESVKRMTDTARENKVAFMDATHFVHHPRTALIQENIFDQIGSPQAVHTSFFFPFLDRTNIRYNTDLEPTGAIGDMAWYSARAIVEYLPNARKIKSIKSFAQHDPETGAILRGSGIIVFNDGSTSNWDIGYNAGVCIMDLDILGTDGLIKLDDFVLDWSKGFAFNDEDHIAGYTLRKGMATPKEFQFVETPSEKSQTTLMIENFAHMVKSSNNELNDASMAKTELTQSILDAIWTSINK